MSAAIIGSTGLVGSYILSTCLAETSPWTKIYTISRRQPKSAGPKLSAVVESDTTKWSAALSGISPAPEVVFSALGTTRAQAGGIAQQWKIDHDLNVELVKAAKAAGVKDFVFISSAGIRGALSGRVPYSKMKQGVEDAVQGAGFDHAVVLRPGLIMGDREVPHGGGPMMNSAVRTLGRWFGQGWQDSLGQEAEVIARAAVAAARLVKEGKAPGKYWVLEAADIVRLGRTEWKE
ncbi:NAD(P)-binding protein [Coniochaeta ligniaria NRRL 30616]|uniref:NAD(P)-binding protein n=1 Tax=Coniochaeta ligniaria NRRL 30616 TaxID=1408157 RepID=A0A1J7IBU0_9PEZI|nr:NAD(P)-binding protein [Coniochaeta ligniaria NRRL 30616]